MRFPVTAKDHKDDPKALRKNPAVTRGASFFVSQEGFLKALKENQGKAARKG